MRSADRYRRLGPAIGLVVALAPAGCHPDPGDPLVVATAWPREARDALEADYRRDSGDPRPITWVDLGPFDRAAAVLDRRGGVDLLVGGPAREFERLAESRRLVPIESSDPSPWRLVFRPGSAPPPPGDPRDDPAALGRARGILRAEGWPKGYERLVREAAGPRPSPVEAPGDRPADPEAVALVGPGRGSARARGFLKALEARGSVGPAPAFSPAADGFLADLLGAALFDAREELRQADVTLARFGHPEKAEAAFGERPPWPPASVAKLQASPSDAPLVETLLEQVAPEPEVRDWLRRSWAGPKRAVDGALLDELAAAADGRLAREPRFRAWLRGEWTAWTRQLYRRVARVAGGYVPS